MLAVLAAVLPLGARAVAQTEPHDTLPPPCPDCRGSTTTTSTTDGSTTTTDSTGTSVSVLPTVTEQPGGGDGGGGGVGVSGGQTPRALSRTGSELLPQLLLAALLIAVGVSLALAARKRRRSAFL